MALRYSSGTGNLYGKDNNEHLGFANYLLIEMNPTKYSSGKWWGEFSTKCELEPGVSYLMEFENSRKGNFTISKETKEKRTATKYYYNFLYFRK